MGTSDHKKELKRHVAVHFLTSNHQRIIPLTLAMKH